MQDADPETDLLPVTKVYTKPCCGIEHFDRIILKNANWHLTKCFCQIFQFFHFGYT